MADRRSHSRRIISIRSTTACHLSEVRGILGAPTDSHDEPIPIVGGTKTTYTYRNNTSEVTIVFKNDQEQSKTGSFGN